MAAILNIEKYDIFEHFIIFKNQLLQTKTGKKLGVHNFIFSFL